MSQAAALQALVMPTGTDYICLIPSPVEDTALEAGFQNFARLNIPHSLTAPTRATLASLPCLEKPCF